MIRLAALVLLTAAACQPGREPPETGLPGFDPNLIAREKATCEESGGRWGQGGAEGAFVCFETTPDAGQSCAAATDCSGLCLARSRSCSPIKPLFGCNEVLDSTGRTATLCVE